MKLPQLIAVEETQAGILKTCEIVMPRRRIVASRSRLLPAGNLIASLDPAYSIDDHPAAIRI